MRAQMKGSPVLFLLAALLLPCTSVWAVDLELADVPLAIKTAGTDPNIMFLIDDSGSMDTNDVFYAPGYDSDKEYRCSSGTVLAAVPGQEMVVYVSRRTGASGIPYFSYNSSFYGWGRWGNSDVAAGATAPNRCFDPDSVYRVKLQANVNTDQYLCPKDYEPRKWNGNWFCKKERDWIPATVIYGDYHYANGEARDYSGNFLNWYFSATAAEYSDDTIDGGYTLYAGDYWSQDPATNFVTSIANSRTMGMKVGAHFGHDRMEVAIDVAKILVRKVSDVNMSLGSFHTRGDGTKTKSQNGYLMHGFVSLSSKEENQAATDSNKLSLIETIANLSADGMTPTSESMVRMARYFFNGWASQAFDYMDGAARTLTSKLISEVLELDNNATDAVAYNALKKNITEDKWCQKNAIAVLTDGQPTEDTGFGGSDGGGELWTYNTIGSTQEDNTTFKDKHGIIRASGALFDHDWLKGMRGMQNIESFFIAFGDEDILDAPLIHEAGKAGGGGVDNSFSAADGSSVIDAFRQIVANVTADSASITAVAVSSVAELQTENYAFQATYDTKFWTSNIKALNVNAEGLFVQPDGSGASRYSSTITPEWLSNEVLSKMYLLNDNDLAGVDVSADNRASGVLSRKVYTWSGTDGMRFGSSTMARPATAASSLAEFNTLPQTLRDDLSALAGTDARERYDLMMYLLGDVTNEQGFPSATASNKYRQRGTYFDSDNDGLVDQVFDGGLLGDIVHSSPVYIQQPSRNWNDVNFGTSSAKYSDYKALQASRPAMVYVGANDGFLHAFTVEPGIKDGLAYPKGGELFAYMPSMLASARSDRGLHFLASPSYLHRFYVDLTASPSDVFMDFYRSGAGSDKLKAEWRSILVGGLGGGGKGYFALDVTCPFVDDDTYVMSDMVTMATNTCADESFNENNVLWEFDGADDTDLGLTFADPVIAKVNYDSGFNYNAAGGTERNGNGNGRWAAIVGNGYNSANGRAALYVLFLDGGLDGVWTEGTDYIKIKVGSNLVDNTSAKNGLSSPTVVDINNDGLVDRVYAGDLKGQMWSFDLGPEATKTQYNAGTGFPWVARLLFTTGVDDDHPQPITTAPMVARDSSKGRSLPTTAPDLMVVFGTGQYLTEDDLQDKSVQSVYAVHDRGTYGLTRHDVVTYNGEEYPMLEPRVFKEELLGTRLNRTIEGDAINSAQFGWYVDLGSDLNESDTVSGTELKGERLVFRSFIAGDLFIFNTVIPVVGSCSGATQGWTMVLDWTEGMAYREETYDADVSGYIDPADQGYVGMFNESAGSELGRGGNNIYDSVGETARSQNFNFGSASISERIGWEERLPFGFKAQ